jgi:predicted ATPase
MRHSVKLDFTEVELLSRKEELEQLVSAFQRVCDTSENTSSNPSSSAIFIEGEGGAGKDLLLDNFWQHALNSQYAEKVLLCRGDFEEGRSSSDPFSAVADSMNMLIGSLVAANEECWKERFTETLKAEAPVLGTIIPWFSELSAEIGPVSKWGLLRESVEGSFRRSWECQEPQDFGLKRLRFAIRSLIRCVCSYQPLVIVLSDLHWGGREAYALLKTLLSDTRLSTQNFMFVGTHRSVERSKGLQDLSNGVRRNQKIHIKLSDLTKDYLGVLLSSLLGREEDEIKSLVEAVHGKTRGTPFFVRQFLELLEERGLLFYSLSSYRWEWDAERIHLETDISDNVVDFVASKIRQMPNSQQITVQTAACLMVTHFQVDVLFHILDGHSDVNPDCEAEGREMVYDDKEVVHIDNVDELRTVLRGAVQDGLLQEINAGVFKFVHDRIREGAYSLLPEGPSRKETHLRIGRKLRHWIKDLSEKQSGFRRLLLLTVMQLNLGAKLITSEAERIDLAALNYQAAKLAMQRSSFFPASDFLCETLNLLGDQPWVEHYDLCMRVNIARMQIEYCCGRPDVSACIADEVLEHAMLFQDKRTAYHTKILWLTQAKKNKEAIELVLSVLKELGAPFPGRLLAVHIKIEEMKIKKMLRGRTDAELLDLPDAHDETIEVIVEFSERLGEIALNSASPIPEYLSLVMLRGMRMTLQHGRFALTPRCFVAWGRFAAQSGCFNEAHRFGKLGLKLAEQRKGGYHDVKAALHYYHEIYHWRLPYHDGLAPASNGLRSLWDRGEIEYVFSDTIAYLRIYYCCGLRLGPLEHDIHHYLDLLQDWGQRVSLENHIPFFQMIANLTGNSNETVVLSGEFMNQEEQSREWTRTGNERALQHMYFHRMMLAYFFNDLELAGQMSEKMWSKEGTDVVSSSFVDPITSSSLLVARAPQSLSLSLSQSCPLILSLHVTLSLSPVPPVGPIPVLL